MVLTLVVVVVALTWSGNQLLSCPFKKEKREEYTAKSQYKKVMFVRDYLEISFFTLCSKFLSVELLVR